MISGDAVTQDGQDAADITITRVSVTTQPADSEFGEPPQNGCYVTAHVKIVVRPDFTGGFDVNSQDFYAKHGTDHFDEGNGNTLEAPATAWNSASPPSAPARPRAARWCSTCPPRTAGSPTRPT